MPQRGNLTAEQLNLYPADSTKYLSGLVDPTTGENVWSVPPGSGGSGTVTHTGALTTDEPVFGNGTADIKVGTKTGNTNQLVTASGAATSGDFILYDANGNAISSGAAGSAKGDLLVYSGSSWVILPVGADTKVLTANSAATNGVDWETSGGGGGGTIPTSGWTARHSPIWEDFSPQRISLCYPDGSGLNWRILTQTLGGATTYTFKATVRIIPPVPVNSSVAGLYLFDGTGLIGFEMINQGAGAQRVRVERMNSVTSDNSTVAGPTVGLVTDTMELKIVKDATHRTFYYANGPGATYTQYYQEAFNAFMTETDVGFGGLNTGTGWALNIELLDWSLV